MNKFLFIICICFSGLGVAQELYPHKLNEKKLNELQKSIQYKTKEPQRWTYDTDQEWKEALRKFQTKKGVKKDDKATGYESEQYVEPVENNTPNNFDFPKLNLGPIAKIIIYIVLGGLLVLLLYFLFVNANFKSDGKKYTSIAIEDISPTEIPKTELQRMLDAALKEENYRKAVRIYYLFIIKDLAEKKWIFWEKQKTNNHYLMEMSNKNEYAHFSTAVTYFEFIWYGKRQITSAQFDIIKPHFTRLLKSLDVK